MYLELLVHDFTKEADFQMLKLRNYHFLKFGIREKNDKVEFSVCVKLEFGILIFLLKFGFWNSCLTLEFYFKKLVTVFRFWIFPPHPKI